MSVVAQQNGAVALPSGSAASVASAASNATSNAASNSTGKPNAAPSEVGWLFVPQYYTFLNNDPSKLHCFYSKRSSLVHGTEQEDVPLCIGQQQIHEKIVSLGFSDAKVYVSNVDSQASASGGIIIQVLGEMSNKGGAWRKFAQTFFLAEQPNGYFVLNDIFRYLKEDDEAEQEAQDIDQALQDEVQEAETQGVDVAVLKEPTSQEADSIVAEAAVQEPVAQPTTQEPVTVPDSIAKSAINGVNEAPSQASQGVESEAVIAAAPAIAPKAEAQTEAVQAAQPPAPSGPKTWANLAAANATRWGTTVNSESRGVSAQKQAATPASAAAKTGAASGPAAGGRTGGASSGGVYSSAQVFIKNVVVDNMPAEGLQAALEAKFGPMKECQVVPSKAVAFAEFGNVEAARKAIQQSLPVSQGGEGGIKVGKNGWAVIVEEKRKPAERTGGAPSAGGAGQGGAGRGGRGGRGAGRGTGRDGGAGRGGRAAA